MTEQAAVPRTKRRKSEIEMVAEISAALARYERLLRVYAASKAEAATPEGLREAIASTLMDLRMDGPWWKPPSTLTYQEAMRHYADEIMKVIPARPAATLDVERLAEALDASWGELLAPFGGQADGLRRSAEAIVANYARLAAEQEAPA